MRQSRPIFVSTEYHGMKIRADFFDGFRASHAGKFTPLLVVHSAAQSERKPAAVPGTPN
jgi:hypothetical protein